MIPIRGITVSVDYGPLLRITLVRNMRHMSECVVVTAPGDSGTIGVAREVPGVRVLETDAFYRYGADFNKGLAMEEGFDFLGRHGWILIWDADCLFPESMPVGEPDPEGLHGARRRILKDPAAWSPDLDWSKCLASRDGGPIGFFQLFHADAHAVKGRRPWYDPTFAHAGGGDAYFMDLFPNSRRRVMPIDVLHLGPKDCHWFGTSPEGRARMDAFVSANGWRRQFPPVASDVPPPDSFAHRVEVPGYKSTYELPFVRRAELRRNSAS